MLTDNEIQVLRDLSIQLADPINEYVIRDICERIAASGKFTASADYMAFRADTLGLRWKKLRKEIAKRLNVTQREVDRLYASAAQRTYMDDVRRLGRGVDFTQNATVQQITRAAAELAQDDLYNITQTLGMVDRTGRELPLREFYGKTMDFVFTNVTAGTMDYNTAVRLASAKLAERGVTSIGYESGVTKSLEAAVRRTVMGGLGLMVEQISRHNFEALGADGWEISAHAMSAPDHEPIQGRQYSAAMYEALNASLVRRIGTLNCGHNAFPIILGVNEPQYTPEELRKMAEDNAKGVTIGGKHYTQYEATQRQRGIERRIRGAKRQYLVSSTNGTTEKAQEAAARLNNLRREYGEFSKAAGLRTQDERLHVSGFGPSEGKAAQKMILTNAAGQGIIPVGQSRTTGPSNGITQRTGETGRIDRNYYDSEGMQIKQISNHNHGNPKTHPFGQNGEHAHDCYWEGEAFKRSDARELTEDERKENTDIL